MLRLFDPAVGAVAPVLGAHPGWLVVASSGGLREAVLADTLRRTAELMGLKVRTTGTSGWDEHNVRPASDDVLVPDLLVGVGEAPRVLRPAPLVPPAGDPLAVRLALLGVAWRVASPLPEDAPEELARWRAAVARWAEEPSGAMVHSAKASLLDAFAEDLDTPRALVVLRAVETLPDISDGSRFETFAWADRLLGLDLARDVGR